MRDNNGNVDKLQPVIKPDKNANIGPQKWPETKTGAKEERADPWLLMAAAMTSARKARSTRGAIRKSPIAGKTYPCLIAADDGWLSLAVR